MTSRMADDAKGPIGEVCVIPDFLPLPHRLVPPDEGVKVTLMLGRLDADFLKRGAERARAHQRKIQAVVDAYARRER